MALVIPGMLFSTLAFRGVDRLAPLLLGTNPELEQRARKQIVDELLADVAALGGVPLAKAEVTAQRAFLQIEGRWVQGSAWHGQIMYGV